MIADRDLQIDRQLHAVGRFVGERQGNQLTARGGMHDRVHDRVARPATRLGRRCEIEATAQLLLDQVDAPHGLDDLVDPPPAHPRVDLDDARSPACGFGFDVEHTAAQPELLNGLDAQVDEPPDFSTIVVGWTVQARLLERWLGRRPVLRHAREHAFSVVHQEVDIELDSVQVLLQQEVVAGAKDVVVFGIHHAAYEGVDPRERLDVVDPHTTHGAGAELGLDHGGESHVGGSREQLVERPHALSLGCRQAQPGRQFAGTDLAPGGVDRVRWVAGQPEGRCDSRSNADAVLPEREDSIRLHAGRPQGIEHGLSVCVGIAEDLDG